MEEYRQQLEARLGKARGLMRGIINRATKSPKRIVFPEGEDLKVLRAAAQLVDDGIAHPVLLGSRARIDGLAHDANVDLEGIEVEDPATSAKREAYARFLWEKRQRRGMSLDEARRRIYNGNYFGSCLVANRDADALDSGENLRYPETIPPALEVIGADPPAATGSGFYMHLVDQHAAILGDTTVNIEPTAEHLAQIAHQASRIARTLGIEPRIAMLSFSNFGSVRHAETEKVARAVELLREKD